MFHPVSSKVNFSQIEERILKLWKDNNIFERSVEQRRGKPSFILYDGPPTVNGSPALHHVLTSAFKDVIPRYKAMKGYYAPRIAGWDTHGLPVELEVEKQLGFSGKNQIEEYGVARFNELCRQNVNRYLGEFEDVIERIAYWVDLKNAYVTMRNEYIESCWWAIKQMWDKGLIYQGYKVTPHCPRCGTSLSSHEVALGYQDNVEDPSIYIKFKTWLLTGKQDEVSQKLFHLALSRDTFFLAWTTTPWTLPGNTALAVAAEADYAVVEVGDEYLILADALRERAGLGNNKVVIKVKGSYLVGAEYEPLFDPHKYGVERRRPQRFLDRDVTRMLTVFQVQEAPKPSLLTGRGLSYKVIDADFVSLEEGTGIVHVAPAFGEVDFEAGMYHDLDFVQPVDLQGKIIGTYPFSGKFVKEADPLVLEDLKSRGLLFRSETIRHTYPFCWRCEAPLLYYAKQTWYIRTTAVKDRLIAGNNEINWYPDYIKYGRFGDWLQNNVDWAFSRERYWGTPLPVWRCESCGAPDCVGGVEELKKKPGLAGFKEPPDLHRPFVDELTYQCAKCGGKMQRVPEVIDCWFDSGAMPIAQFHYPFENQSMFEDGRFPADFISEAVDQTRGWFYSLHAISTLLFDRVCYRNVICLGHLLDAKGEKMSKSKGNVVWPWEVIKKYGADALRWYFFTSSPPGNVRRFDEKMVLEVTRRFFLTLWNVYSFFVTYANIDHFTPGTQGTQFEPAELDRWILSELNQLIMDVDSALEHYDPTEAGRKIESFVDELSNWYVRRSRRRFWRSENDADKISAYHTLYQCLVTLSKLLAPFTPFLADELYQNLVLAAFPDAPESVHLADFPVADEAKIDQRLSADIQLAMRVASLGRAARSQASIKVRQPLAEVMVRVNSEREKEGLGRVKAQVLDELNVKDLKFIADMETLDRGSYSITSEGNYWVAVPTRPSSELEAEGMAREVVHRLQTMRRAAGFEIADHIVISYQGDEHIRKVMMEFGDYIRQETLAEQLLEKTPEPGAFTESHKLGEHKVSLSVKRLD
jgi:isoleucyl-tRNA synthetase